MWSLFAEMATGLVLHSQRSNFGSLVSKKQTKKNRYPANAQVEAVGLPCSCLVWCHIRDRSECGAINHLNASDRNQCLSLLRLFVYFQLAC